MSSDCKPEDSAESPKQPNGWRSRGYLPHFDGGPIPQSITIRLFDSFPQVKLDEWEQELRNLPREGAMIDLQSRIESFLDKGTGVCWLVRTDVAERVEQNLFHFDGERYSLHAWAIMPNHLHVLVTPYSRCTLSQIIHGWKSFTAKSANKVIGRTGAFWQSDYFDRFIRSDRHFRGTVSYIENNPVKAGLCSNPGAWPYSSARFR